jgi:threonine dehydrogenase-like Zn-dependent dehydrogenase
MKQLLQYLRNGRTVVEDVPVPSVRPGMALVRTHASLVSAGTERMLVEFARQSLLGKARRRPDLVKQVIARARREGWLTAAQTAFSRLDQPLALGYSSAGTIVQLGTGMSGFKVGDRVACAGGGYAVHAEYAVVPRNLLAPFPSTLDFESAAFATLGAIGMHGFRLARPQVGEHVAVIGLGLLGLLSAQIAAAAGCRVFGVDVDPSRLRLASSLGIPGAARAQALQPAMAFTHGRGFDVLLICADTTSNDPVEFAAALARDRARIIAIGAVGQTLPRRLY